MTASSSMIHCVDLHKAYGPVTALQDVSFAVTRGRIVGLLGPNGAGKTTCMRIVAGSLRPTRGNVRIADLDMTHHGCAIRRKIGFLPEGAPLYPDLRVREYLEFRARLYAAPRRQRRAQIERCLSLCGLAQEAHAVIGRMSRGYRQRVGLAAALLPDPELLILDEPTAGLDPNQQRAVRCLIRDMAGHKTVLLSTHVLGEVEAVCDEVLIIDQGRLLAAGPVEAVCREHGRGALIVEVRGSADVLATLLGPFAAEVTLQAACGTGDQTLCTFRLAGDLDGESTEALVAAIQQSGSALRALHRERGRLEQVFERLTARVDA